MSGPREEYTYDDDGEDVDEISREKNPSDVDEDGNSTYEKEAEDRWVFDDP